MWWTWMHTQLRKEICLEKISPKGNWWRRCGKDKHCLMRSGLWADNGLSAVHRHATMSNQHIHMHADIPNTKYWISNTKYWILNIKYQILNTEYQTLSTEYQIPNTEHWISNTKYWILNTKFRGLEGSHRTPRLLIFVVTSGISWVRESI